MSKMPSLNIVAESLISLINKFVARQLVKNNLEVSGERLCLLTQILAQTACHGRRFKAANTRVYFKMELTSTRY